jgi:hypothetical protein
MYTEKNSSWFSSIAYSGANPSSEEADEALEDGVSQVNNVIHSFRLQSTSFDKKSYLAYLKVRPRLLAIPTHIHCLIQYYRVT